MLVRYLNHARPMTRSRIAALSAALLLFTAPLAAQSPVASSTRGFFLGAHLNASSVSIDEDEFETEEESGGGFGLQLGYGFTSRLALFIEGTAAEIETDVALAHVDLGLRYAFTNPTRRWVPSLEVALTGRAIAENDADVEGETADVSLTGGGVTLGAGLQYYLTPKWAIGAAVKWTGGEFSDFTVDNVTIGDLDIDATSTRLNFGVTWYPMGGR